MPERVADDPLDALGQLVASMDPDDLAAYEQHLGDEERQLLERAIAHVTGEGWRATPLTMGVKFGKLVPYPHSQLLARKFVEAFEGRSPRQIWAVPPQHGKSLTASRWGPAWALDADPTINLALASYGDRLARENALAVRDILVEHRLDLRVVLRRDRRGADRFVTEQGGGLVAAGVGSGLSGFSAHGVIVDDPFRNWQEAHSPARRELVWNWFRSVVRTRLNHRNGIPGFLVVVMCMTGDTPVLMADGSERTLRDIRPGDLIATYEAGRLTTSTVRNWANQGPDTIYEIRTKSGASVRANARHPFLTIEDGAEVWRRTETLKPGSRILRATGGNGGESRAPLSGAPSQRGARACACPTTTRHDGLRDIGPRPLIPQHGGQPGSSIATALPPRSMTVWSPSRTGGAPSAVTFRPSATPAPIGTGNSASTTTTTPAKSGASCVMTATLPSATAALPNGSALPPTMWSVTVDEVIEVVPAGVEDVFDLQVDRTENFIANGLVSHNTRWHESDLAGMLLAQDEAGEGEGWELVRLPAIAEEADLLGREVGESLAPDLHPLEELNALMLAAGSYLCTPAETPILMADWTVRPISEVKVGDGVVGFLREPGHKTQYVPTRVLGTSTVVAPVCDYELDSGRIIRATRDHRWYTRLGRPYRPANIGTPLRFVCEVDEEPTVRERELWQYLAGMLDGEGSFKNRSAINVVQAVPRNASVILRLMEVLDELQIAYTRYERGPSREGQSDQMGVNIREAGRVCRALLRWTELGKRDQAAALLYGGSGRTTRYTDRVAAIKEGDEELVYALETGTGNYVAWGYASSNSAGLYQQRPAPEEGSEVMRGWWRWESTMPTRWDAATFSWDTKMKDKEGGDFVVGQAWVRTGSDFWCLDQLRGQWNFVTTKTAIALMAVRHPTITTHVVENAGNGPEVMADLRRAQPGYEVGEDVRSQLGITDAELPKVNAMFRNGIPGLVPQNVREDKLVRLRTQLGLIEAGNVHLPEGRDWAVALVNEHAAFPNGAHDDIVDCTSQALKRLRVAGGYVPPPSDRPVAKPRPSARARSSIGRPKPRYG